MAKNKDEYYAVATRSMLSEVKEIGAMPLILFEYYLTWLTAPEGIKPSLETIALDLGILNKQGKPSKSAVCNLKKTLIEKKWIKEENGQIYITKSFRKNESEIEQRSEKMNDLSENLNNRSEKMNGTNIAKIGFNSENSKKSKGGSKPPATADAEKTENPPQEHNPSLNNSSLPKRSALVGLACGIVGETEKVLGVPLNQPVQFRITQVVDAQHESIWLDMVRNRGSGVKHLSPQKLNEKVGYWLDDFSRYNKPQTESKFYH